MPLSNTIAEPEKIVIGSIIGANTLLDIEKIRQLIQMMVSNDLVEISLRDGDVEVSLRRPTANAGVEHVSVTTTQIPNVIAPTQGDGQGNKDKDDDIELMEISSPMVGTFYNAPDPDAPPFVKIGTHVHTDTVVCIVEAMKVFNEIKAEVSGTIERILVKNEQSLEYGQPMFLIRPQ